MDNAEAHRDASIGLIGLAAVLVPASSAAGGRLGIAGLLLLWRALRLARRERRLDETGQGTT